MEPPTRLKTVLQVGTVIGVPQSSCVLMLATVYRYLGKKGKHLRIVGVRERERERELLDKKILGEGDLKLFIENLGMGEWAPLFYPPFQPYPPLHIPQGVSRGTGFAWQCIDQGHDGRPQAQAGPQGRPPMAPRQAQGITRPTGRFINQTRQVRMGK
jgi:hypothetical protein